VQLFFVFVSAGTITFATLKLASQKAATTGTATVVFTPATALVATNVVQVTFIIGTSFASGFSCSAAGSAAGATFGAATTSNHIVSCPIFSGTLTAGEQTAVRITNVINPPPFAGTETGILETKTLFGVTIDSTQSMTADAISGTHVTVFVFQPFILSSSGGSISGAAIALDSTVPGASTKATVTFILTTALDNGNKVVFTFPRGTTFASPTCTVLGNTGAAFDANGAVPSNNALTLNQITCTIPANFMLGTGPGSFIEPGTKIQVPLLPFSPLLPCYCPLIVTSCRSKLTTS
jgi:hypothetical protein